jgi:hypothetical protein
MSTEQSPAKKQKQESSSSSSSLLPQAARSPLSPHSFPDPPNNPEAIAEWMEDQIGDSFDCYQEKSWVDLVSYFENNFGLVEGDYSTLYVPNEQMGYHWRASNEGHNKVHSDGRKWTETLVLGLPLFVYSLTDNRLCRTSVGLVKNAVLEARLAKGSRDPPKCLWIIKDNVYVLACRCMVTNETMNYAP